MTELRAHATAKWLPATKKREERFMVKVGAYDKWKCINCDLVLDIHEDKKESEDETV